MTDKIALVTAQKAAATDWLAAEKARAGYKTTTSAKTRAANALKTSTSWAALVAGARAIVAAADAVTPPAPPVHGDPAPPVTPPTTPPADTPPASGAIDWSLPSLTMASVNVDPGAAFAYVTVVCSHNPPLTIRQMVTTQNGNDPDDSKNAKHSAPGGWMGGNLLYFSRYLTFEPGGPLTAVLEIPIMRGEAGKSFWVLFPDQTEPSGVERGPPAKVTFVTGAANPKPAVYPQPVPATPAKGALLYAFDPNTFTATDTGYDAAGKPCWRSSFWNGKREQLGQEPVGYGDPTKFRDRSWELVGGILIQRVESRAITVPEGRNYAITASVLNTSTLLNRQYCYVEWDAKCPPGGWPGLWMYGWNSKDELDAMERWPGDPKTVSSGSLHSDKIDVTSRFLTDRLFGQGLNFVDEFHRHAMDVRPDKVTWLIDDRIVMQADNPGLGLQHFMMDMTVPNGVTVPAPLELATRSFKVWA